jgi:dsRNA-specific ribonuclease
MASVQEQRQAFDLDKYTTFIKRLLKMAKINTEYCELLTTPPSMKIFVQAVTHNTFNSVTNYEKLEFIGDGIIKAVNSQYIPRRFPNIAKEGDLSKIRRFLEKEKTLSKLAEKLGFWEFAQADSETLTTKKTKTLEDIFESFIGAMVQVIDKEIKRGLGYNYAYNFIESQLNELPISLESENLDDSITRLNELYKASELKNGKTPLKWGDVLFINESLSVPRVESIDKAPKEDLKQGQLIFSDKDRTLYIYYNNKWTNAFFNTPLISIISPPPKKQLPNGERDPTIQLIWYAGAYGFLNKTNKFVSVNGKNARNIQEHIDEYGGDLIGQSFAFKTQHAKLGAASAAIAYLKKKGIEAKPKE